MKCHGFVKWLDRGADSAEVEGMAASMHASVCPRCASSLRRFRRIELVLGIPLAAPQGIAERTLAEIATGVRSPAAGEPSLRARAFVEAAAPVTVLISIAATLATSGTALDALVGDPASLAAITGAILPALAWAAWQLYQTPSGFVEGT